MKQYAQLYKTELLENIIPFWTKHSVDKQHGGFFTCLDRSGKVYDTDKFAWLQGRQVWTYSMLYKQVEQNVEWLEIAQHGADFLLKNGRNTEGNFYFSFNQQGQPLIQPYSIFSDCFAAMGFGALYKADPQDRYAEVAQTTFQNILNRRNNPKGKYSKAYHGIRNLKGFSLPMILCNLSLELEHLLDKKLVSGLIDEIIYEVMEVFYQEETGLILENVQTNGQFSDSFEGRLINPGHAIEAMWFIMDLGSRLNNSDLINKAVEIALRMVDYGWDNEFEGILYFKDVKGHPVQQLEWDQKLWWVHVEALVCMAKAYQLTGNTKCMLWFEKLHQYTWSHFKDAEYGEWFGYLNRRGEVLLSLKGGKWKGCFHIPRALFQVWNTLEKIKSEENPDLKNHVY